MEKKKRHEKKQEKNKTEKKEKKNKEKKRRDKETKTEKIQKTYRQIWTNPLFKTDRDRKKQETYLY